MEKSRIKNSGLFLLFFLYVGERGIRNVLYGGWGYVSKMLDV